MKGSRAKPALPEQHPISLCPGLWGGRHRRDGAEGYLVYDPARGREEFFSGEAAEALAWFGAGRAPRTLPARLRPAAESLWRRGLLAHTPHHAPPPSTGRTPPASFAARPGASFRCHSCGLCCRALHALGPVSDDERDTLVQLAPTLAQTRGRPTEQLLQLSPPEEAGGRWLYQIATQRGRCVFLTQETRCSIHAAHGAAAKPTTCRAFPLQLAEIGGEGRAIASSRCPAVSLGPGDPLDEDELRGLAQSGAPVLRPDEPPCGWPAYRDAEAMLLERLSSPEPLASIGDLCSAFLARLGLPPIPALGPGALHALSRRLVHEQGPRGGESLAAAAWGLRWRLGAKDKCPPRPWKSAFDHPDELCRDERQALLRHLADQVFLGELLLYRDLAEGAFRLWARSSLIRSHAKALVQAGLAREPRATAEAIYVWDVATGSDAWRRFSPKLAQDQDPSPTPRPKKPR